MFLLLDDRHQGVALSCGFLLPSHLTHKPILCGWPRKKGHIFLSVQDTRQANKKKVTAHFCQSTKRNQTFSRKGISPKKHQPWVASSVVLSSSLFHLVKFLMKNALVMLWIRRSHLRPSQPIRSHLAQSSPLWHLLRRLLPRRHIPRLLSHHPPSQFLPLLLSPSCLQLQVQLDLGIRLSTLQDLPVPKAPRSLTLDKACAIYLPWGTPWLSLLHTLLVYLLGMVVGKVAWMAPLVLVPVVVLTAMTMTHKTRNEPWFGGRLVVQPRHAMLHL